MNKTRKMTITTIAIISILVLCSGGVYAGGEDNFLFSAVSNSAWILDKNTGKLIFIQFQKPDEIWKSNIVIVPSEFNLDRCILKTVGGRGTSVFIHDPSTGMTTFYDVQKDQSVESYMVINISNDLK